jgi:hypothetical protein
MRARSQNTRILLGQRPFAGDLGASLYAGTPAGVDIRYRRNKPVCPGALWWPVSTTETIDPGAASVDKTQRVASVTSPTDSIAYTLPAELLGVNVACQVRTYQDDYENETIYRPVIVGVDGGGDPADAILGTAVVITQEKRDSGGLRVQFAYTASRDGLQPTEFALVKTSGSGTVADVVITASGRSNTIIVTGLTDGVTYGFRLEARNGSVTASLATLTFTADATGPGDPISVVATPY